MLVLSCTSLLMTGASGPLRGSSSIYLSGLDSNSYCAFVRSTFFMVAVVFDS